LRASKSIARLLERQIAQEGACLRIGIGITAKRLPPRCASAAASFAAADEFALLVSTTHVLSSGIAGTMVANRSGLQWSTALASALTLPVAMAIFRAPPLVLLEVVLSTARPTPCEPRRGTLSETPRSTSRGNHHRKR